MAKKIKEENTEKISKLQETLTNLNKKYGAGTILALDSKTTGDYDVISTGSIGFDYITLGVGGFVKGKLYELMGWEGCLSGDTFIQFRTTNLSTKKTEHKGGSLYDFYCKFNKIQQSGRGKTLRKDINDCIFTVPSINEDGFIVHSVVKNVLFSGKKEVFLLKTLMGYEIKATSNHEFYTGNKWERLDSLKIGDSVYIHNNTTFKKSNQKRLTYKEVSVKYHPKWEKRMISGKYEFYRNRRSRAAYEAHLNNFTYEEYIKFLNTAPREDINKLNFIPDGFHIHHINENTLDDDLINLTLIDGKLHNQHHANKNQNNLRFICIEDNVLSIEKIGTEDTYDIICEEPYRNFVANNIVVHNSGKSTICGHAAAECQKKGGVVAYVDGEHAVDKKYFQALGVDTEKMLIAQPSSGEEGFNIVSDLVDTGEIDLIIIDSDSSLIPKGVMDGEIGDSTIGKKARLNNNAYPKLKGKISDKNVCVIVVSQYREKIGVMFGNPTTTQGGHALKFYSDCRIEVSKSLAKDGDVNYGNVTKVKATKNKMSPPYRQTQFEVLYGKGIDRYGELMQLASDFKIAEKWGKSITYKEEKMPITEFEEKLKNEAFFDDVRAQIVEQIKNTDIKVEESVTDEIS
jgi:recombination protein RecA